MKTGKTQFKSKQLSARTGEIKTEFLGDRISIMGQAVTIMKISLL